MDQSPDQRGWRHRADGDALRPIRLHPNRRHGLLQLGPHDMGYIWDNNASTTYGYNSQEVIGASNWSMVAVVITPTNSMIYVGNSNILTAVTQVIANSNEPWGAGVAIGGDPGQNPINNSFGGFMSSVAMFTTRSPPRSLKTSGSPACPTALCRIPSLRPNPIPPTSICCHRAASLVFCQRLWRAAVQWLLAIQQRLRLGSPAAAPMFPLPASTRS